MILDNKTIIVTGGSLGIGFEISKKIALEGGTVIMVARNKDDLINATNYLEKISGNKHYYFCTDISKLTNCLKFAKFTYESSDIYGLINCAGIYGPIGSTKDVNMKDFFETIEINLMGTIYMCNLFSNSKTYITNKRKIINFSGGGGTSPFPNYSAYATSKAAIIRFTENLAIELSENFDVNCIAPGFVATRLHQATLEAGSDIVGEDFYQSTINQLNNGGVSPELAANLAIFLLSDDSNGITGKIISAPWDDWSNSDFQELLKNDKDFATLRRIDNKNYFKK
jgi:NAD(P)-dependent dehydrogenase (short-subunit alcohol dehydrogenase family)